MLIVYFIELYFLSIDGTERMIWVSWPNKTSKVISNMSEDRIRA